MSVGRVLADGVELVYDVHGRDTDPTLLLLHSLGTTSDLWGPQRAAFGRSYRVVRLDLRGHGRSAVPPAPYTIDQLGQDAATVLDAVGASRAHVCGVSLGGLVAVWLGLRRPERVDRLVTANTASRLGSRELWEARIRAVRASGVDGVSREVVSRWFTPAFARRQPATVGRFRTMLARCAVEGYVGCCAALRDADLDGDAGRLAAPILVVIGARDEAAPPEAGARLATQAPRGQRLELEAAHLSNVEQPEAFTAGVLQFLAR